MFRKKSFQFVLLFDDTQHAAMFPESTQKVWLPAGQTPTDFLWPSLVCEENPHDHWSSTKSIEHKHNQKSDSWAPNCDCYTPPPITKPLSHYLLQTSSGHHPHVLLSPDFLEPCFISPRRRHVSRPEVVCGVFMSFSVSCSTRLNVSSNMAAEMTSGVVFFSVQGWTQSGRCDASFGSQISWIEILRTYKVPKSHMTPHPVADPGGPGGRPPPLAPRFISKVFRQF